MICAAAGLFSKALGPKLMLESAENVMLQRHACTRERECVKVKIIGAGVCTWADATQRRKFPLCEIGNGAVELSCQAAPSTHGRLTFGVGGARQQQQHMKQSPVDGFVIEGAHNSSSFVFVSPAVTATALFVTTQNLLRLLLLAVFCSQTSLLSFNQIAMKFDLPSGLSLVKDQVRDARVSKTPRENGTSARLRPKLIEQGGKYQQLQVASKRRHCAHFGSAAFLVC
jgi:hypothetical protein